MTTIRAQWLRFSEETNALDYLEKAHYFLTQLPNDKRAWKWVIICLHTSLYGWAICALRGTNLNQVVVTTKKGYEKLIPFGEAIKRCQNPNCMCMTVNSRVLTLTDSQRISIQTLKQTFRDNFEHFVPKGWSIETHGFPQMSIDIFDVIHFLALESGNYIHLRSYEERRIRSLIFQSKRLLKGLRLHQEALVATSFVG
jgi:hypothetical protein